ncbi:hypothetical protein LJC34_02260 [Oscillospiraceae bacterium OttesenSCG-928-G22]|nr:hypothetical protein [Oscillospiraceae bacterium OttesenSCG-928-G22]
MAKFLAVFSLQFRSFFGTSELRDNLRKNKKLFLLKVAVLLAVVLLFGAFLVFYTMLLSAYIGASAELGLRELTLMLPILAAMTVTLIFGVVSILGVLFQAKDIEFLAALPLRQQTVFAAKFLIAYLTELVVTLFFVVPAVVLYGREVGAGLAFYLKSALTVLLIPMVPLVLSALLALLISRILSRLRRRETLFVVFGVLLLMLFVVGQLVLSNALSRTEFDAEALTALLQRTDEVLRLAGRAFPPAGWAALGLTSQTAATQHFLLFVLVSIAAFALVCFVSSKVYQRGATALLESGKSSPARRAGPVRATARSPLAALALREWRMLIRTPIYALNALVGIVLFPVMLFVLPLTLPDDIPLAALAELGVDLPPHLLFAVAFVVMLFVCFMNPAAGSAVSREGAQLWVVKTIPVSYGRQIAAKLIVNTAIPAVTIVLTAAALGVHFPPLLPIIAAGGLFGILASVSVTALSMLPDVLRPKLLWKSETEAIKQNMNVVLGMLLSVVLTALYGAVAIALHAVLPPIAAYAGLFLVLALADAGSVLLLTRVAGRKLASLEP